MNLGSIGAGNMAGAIIRGLLARGFAQAATIRIHDRDEAKAHAFAHETGVTPCQSNAEVVAGSDAVLLAVKPGDFPALLASLQTEILGKKPLLLSIATGTTLASIAGGLGDTGNTVPIVRIIPNVNARVGEGVAGICPNSIVTEEQLAWTEKLFNSVGRAIRIDEDKFSVFQAVACASPAWTFMFIEGLARGGVKKGLTKEQATAAAAQAVLGSARLVLETGLSPSTLVDTVCSPGGTTIAGVAALEEGAMIGTIMKAVEKCYERDLEILANTR
ncbi:MAG: pyrroline-5-carboxylate reductase [Desulfovibrio sp.]|jgi:pyrroline-5-carboxylate reductase|nr:pyrroline-5-carboxylate reductase [Desulfovibrio sp.]